MRQIRKIIVHCSDTDDGPGLNASAIRRFHTSWRCDGRAVTKDEATALQRAHRHVEPPWSDVGYHALVEDVAGEFEVVLGRPVPLIGTHCRGENADSLGVCFVGDYDEEAPPRAMLEVAALRVIAPWILQFSLPPAAVYPHRQYDPGKTCPGSKFDMADLHRAIREALASMS